MFLKNKIFFLALCIIPFHNAFATTYKILGSSSKLQPKQLDSMLRWRNEVVCRAQQDPGHIIINGPTNKKVVALTFDDGPDEKVTPRILDTLKKYHIKATFFFLGNRIEKYKKIVVRAHHEGHLVLSHGWSHPHFSQLTDDQIRDEITKTEHCLHNIIGKGPLFLRPPYGEINTAIMDVVKSLNYKAILWSLDTLDWLNRQKDSIAHNVIKNVRPGEIILMHSNEDKMATADALPLFIKNLKARGFCFVSLDGFLKPLTAHHRRVKGDHYVSFP